MPSSARFGRDVAFDKSNAYHPTDNSVIPLKNGIQSDLPHQRRVIPAKAGIQGCRHSVEKRNPVPLSFRPPGEILFCSVIPLKNGIQTSPIIDNPPQFPYLC
jgi:hypothetical protein